MKSIHTLQNKIIDQEKEIQEWKDKVTEWKGKYDNVKIELEKLYNDMEEEIMREKILLRQKNMEEQQKATADLEETKRQLQEERDTFQNLIGRAKEFVGFCNINTGASVEEVGLRQQQRKLKQYKSHVEKALWFGRTFGLIPHVLELKMTESNEMVKVKFNDEGEATKVIASNAMTRTQTIICFSVREPGAALSLLAIRFECVHTSVFC